MFHPRALPPPRPVEEAETHWHGGGGHWDPLDGHVPHYWRRGAPNHPADEPKWHPGGGHLDPTSGHVPHQQVRLPNPSWAIDVSPEEELEMARREAIIERRIDRQAERQARLANPANTLTPFTAEGELLPTGWRITIRSGRFTGHADFPLSMGDVARDRLQILKRSINAQDVEDLLREFGSDEDFYEWMKMS